MCLFSLLGGKVKIWHKNRILVSGKKGDNSLLKKLLITDQIEKILNKTVHEKVEPFDIKISKSSVKFNNAVKIDDWFLLWNSEKRKKQPAEIPEKITSLNAEHSFTSYTILIFIALFFGLYLMDRHNKIKSGKMPGLSQKQKNLTIVTFSALFLTLFFMTAKGVSPIFLREVGYELPLPIFTFLVAIVDGFNPCNMFVLTFLLALLVSVSHSRLRIYTVGYTFIAVVYIIYFLFMAAWLNIFKYIGFVTPLRVTIAVIAIAAGFINCKELFFFKKGISLTTSEKGKSILQRKARGMRDTIKHGTMPVLITSSVILAAFASLIELPCTAGFPIIYTSVLSGMKISSTTFTYYLWLALYNIVYIIPLAVIIAVFGYTFKGKAISETAVRRIKFIGGFIMILLGIILLVNPEFIGIGIK